MMPHNIRDPQLSFESDSGEINPRKSIARISTEQKFVAPKKNSAAKS
jgi:hypothetical protein